MRPPARNIFVLPHEDRFILYAPLRGLVAEINAAAAEQIRMFAEIGDPAVVDPGISKALGDLAWVRDKGGIEDLPLDRPFEPSRVTLFLTNRCNLRCTYCYACAGEFQPRDIPFDLCKASIDFVSEHARTHNLAVGVGFHGGGEPTLAWEVLGRCVRYARDAAVGYPPGVDFGLSTNGVLSDEQIDFVAETFPTVTLSFDGPRDIQDAQRPRADGRGSFDNVMHTAHRFDEKNVTFVIRSTVTSLNVRRMTEMVNFFVQEVGCRYLHFEPAFSCGRGVASGNGSPDAVVFAEEYIKALDRAIELEAGLRYSPIRLRGPMLSFCGVAQDGFSVTPYGQVTACYEVCNPEHPLADDFVYGHYDAAAGAFRFNSDKIQRLRSLVVTNKTYCDGCFCRYGCAGDCPVKFEGTRLDFQSPSARCGMNQTITKALLVRALQNPDLLKPWTPPISS